MSHTFPSNVVYNILVRNSSGVALLEFDFRIDDESVHTSIEEIHLIAEMGAYCAMHHAAMMYPNQVYRLTRSWIDSQGSQSVELPFTHAP